MNKNLEMAVYAIQSAQGNVHNMEDGTVEPSPERFRRVVDDLERAADYLRKLDKEMDHK